MKRLFLASSGLSYIKEFVGIDPSTLKMLFVPTAGNLDEDKWWIDKDRDVLTKMGFQLKELDIEETSRDMLTVHLNHTDILYVAGGNTFYLLKQFQETGFDKLVIDYVEKDGLYAGASAGSLIAGQDIEPVTALDEPEKVTNLTSTHGLGLVNIVPIPHYDFHDRSAKAEKIKKEYSDKYEIILLTDDQAIVVEDQTYKIVDSPRSKLEMEWLNNSSDS